MIAKGWSLLAFVVVSALLLRFALDTIWPYLPAISIAFVVGLGLFIYGKFFGRRKFW